MYMYNQMKDKAQNLKSNEKPQKITSFLWGHMYICIYKVNKKSINLHFVLTTKKSEIVIQTHVKITIIITFEILIYWYIVRWWTLVLHVDLLVFLSLVDNGWSTHGVQTTNSGPAVNQVVTLQQIIKTCVYSSLYP